MVFELNAQLTLDFPRGVLHRIDSLQLAVWQTIHKIGGGYFAAVNIFDHAAVLSAQGSVVFFIFRPPRRHFLKVLEDGAAKVNRAFGVARFRCNELDKPILILHLSVDGDCSCFQIDMIPLQSETFIDTQTAIPPEEISGFRIGIAKVFIQQGALLFAE